MLAGKRPETVSLPTSHLDQEVSAASRKAAQGRPLLWLRRLARLHSCDPLLATDAPADRFTNADGGQAEEQMYDLDDPVRGTGIWENLFLRQAQREHEQAKHDRADAQARAVFAC